MNVIEGKESRHRFSVAVVASRFNEPITGPLLEGALERLKELDFAEDQITVVKVPGAVEIPLIAQRLAQQAKYEAIIALGAVIRGETAHFDYVCDQVSQGCLQVGLQYDVPVIFGVLTTENAAQARDRIGGAHGHKGREAVDAAVETVAVLQQIR